MNRKFKNNLVGLADKLEISEKVIFNGEAPNSEQVILSADMMLNFSESESFSMTTLEALAYGTPIIATKCGGPSEIIEDGRSGLLVPVNDIAAMAKAIEKLANDDKLRKSFVVKGLKRVNEKFNFEHQINLLKSLYDGLLNQPKSN